MTFVIVWPTNSLFGDIKTRGEEVAKPKDEVANQLHNQFSKGKSLSEA